MKRNLLTVIMLCLGLTVSLAQASSAKKRAVMWVDATANFRSLSSPDSIDYYLGLFRELGFTDVAVDVRPISGEVLFPSPHAPLMREWKGYRRPDFDYLGRFISTGHRLGLKVHATLNCFVAGHNFIDRGQIYSDHPEWASIVFTPKGMMPITSQKEKYSAMVNPCDTTFMTHICQVLTDLVKAYPQLDGVILDRVRYDGIETDFSELSRRNFEKWSGAAVEHWPDDIFKWKKDSYGNFQPERGPRFVEWIDWRAHVIYDAMARLRNTVKAANPKVSFGTYTGAWYPTYYEVGVNFASKDYDPSKDYDWAAPDYHETGYRELLDLYLTGNYYTDMGTEDAASRSEGVKNETDWTAHTGSWYSVEGSCRHLRGIFNGQPFCGGVLVDQLYGQPGKLSRAIAINLRESDGLMVFDLSHLRARPALWQEVKDGMKKGGMLP